MMIFDRIRVGAAACGLALALAAGVAGAQTISPEHMSAARAAVAASDSTASMDEILPTLGVQAKQQLIESRPDKAEEINVMVDDITIDLAPRRGDLEEEIARIYAQIFTQQELEQISAFYQTDAGKKLIDQTPTIARAMDEAARVWTAGVRRDLQQAIGEKMQAGALQ